MGTKMAVAFANIFMAKIETEILRQSNTKPIFWKRYIDDVIAMWNTSIEKIEEFILEANSFHPTIKFTAEIAETETTFLDTKVYKGDRFRKESILDVRTHFKPTDLSIHEFLFVSSTRRHERLYKRRSVKASKNEFLSIHF